MLIYNAIALAIHLIPIAFIIFFFACKKEEGQIKGKVTNLFDNSPIAGIGVKIQYNNKKWINNKSGSLSPMTTNANGEFSVDASFKKNYIYYASLDCPESNLFVEDTTSTYLETYHYYSSYYNEIDPRQDFQNIEKNESQYLEFKIVPTARLNIVAVDQFPPISSSLLIVMVDDAKVVYPGFYQDELGSASKPGKYKYVVPHDNIVKIKWSTNGSVYVTDSIILEPFNKATYFLNY